jgi:mannan endo-1,4-beta-mannosidase
VQCLGFALALTIHQYYGTGLFYESINATTQFDNRLKHILNHQHSTLGVPWKQLSGYIFGFEAQNEAMSGNGESYIQAHTNWQCDRAKTIKTTLGSNSGVIDVIDALPFLG